MEAIYGELRKITTDTSNHAHERERIFVLYTGQPLNEFVAVDNLGCRSIPFIYRKRRADSNLRDP